MIPHEGIVHLFNSYLSIYPEEGDNFPVLAEQLKDSESDITSRKNFTGHIIADGMIIDPRHKKILLIHHAKYHRWQNPGGHIEDSDEHPASAALREVIEETGMNPTPVLDENKQPLLLHIDSHRIPANEKKMEPEHWHHGMTFLFLADSTRILPKNIDDGVLKCQWFDISDMPVEKRISGMIHKIELF